jgi:prepilin-type N-terminal cleavage/methylation domain-containing protein
MSARDEQGFTLAEVIISVAIAGMMVALFTLIINQITTITAEGNKELAMQVDLQNTAAWLHRDAMESDTTKRISSTQIVLSKYESLDEKKHTITATRTITYTVVGMELIREDSASSSPAMTIARNVECVRFQILPGGEVITGNGVITVVRGAPVRAVVASHLPGMESRSAIMDMDMRADGPLEIPASYTATIPAPEVIAWDDFSSGWSGGEGWAWEQWAHAGDVDADSGCARLGGSDDLHRRAGWWGYGGWSAPWGDPTHIARQVTIPDCTTDLTIEFDAKAENFQAGDEASLLVAPDGIHWEEVQTWSEDTVGFQPYDIPVHPGGTVCDLYIKFEALMWCPGHWGDWYCCPGSHSCFWHCEDWVCDDPGTSNFYVDNLVIQGR